MVEQNEVTPVDKNHSGKVFPEKSKVLDLSKLTEDEITQDPLLSMLKKADLNGDGTFSAYEVMTVCRNLNETTAAKEASDKMVKRLAMFAGLLGFLLMLSMVGNFCSTLWAIQVSKENSVPETSGVMLTRPKQPDAPPAPVGTSIVKVITAGISGLKESTKEELDKLEEISFYHDGGYHKMKASQVHRYDGRVEIWGSPVGIVVVEDTGEVHYAPFGVPSVAFDNCFGENATNATNTSEEICGESVDNEPPSNLEVEDPKEEDPDNAPAPAGSEGRRLAGIDEFGEAIWDEFGEENEAHAEARRLSSRRRAGGGSRRRAVSTSSRRRSGGSYSARRRASGSYNSASVSPAYGNSRRRAQVASLRRRTPGSIAPASVGRRRVVQNVDGAQRRRYPNYYNTPTDSRRRDIGAGHVAAAGGAGLVAGGAAGYLAGSHNSGSNSGSTGGNNPPVNSQQYYTQGGSTVIAGSGNHNSVRICPTNFERKCSGSGSCWCEEIESSGKGAWLGFVIGGAILLCCCIGCVLVAMNSS